MNVLFLSFCYYESINNHDIYTDLLREFANNGHHIFLMSPTEDKKVETGCFLDTKNSSIIKVKIPRYFNVNPIKKGITLLRVDKIVLKSLKKYLKNTKIDLIMYATPPIMFLRTITYFKKRGSKSLLLLKDIYPQNAVDLGLMSKGFLYKFFKKKEIKLYEISDRIGCMSKANLDYLLANYKISSKKVFISPNAVNPHIISCNEQQRRRFRELYNLPIDKKIFVYGGNIGEPQGVDFIKQCLLEFQALSDCYFLIVGGGARASELSNFILNNKLTNSRLINKLSKDQYDEFVSSCDYGLIFLDYRFTIPNYPSRLLSYMEARLPVVCSVDKVTDIGKDIESGGFGVSVYSNDPKCFVNACENIMNKNYLEMQKKEEQYLFDNFSVSKQYKEIINLFGDQK